MSNLTEHDMSMKQKQSVVSTKDKQKIILHLHVDKGAKVTNVAF